MKNMPFIKFTLLVVTFSAGLSYCATEAVKEVIDVTPIRTDTRAQAEMISTMAVRSLRYIADARGALKAQAYSDASNDLVQSRSLLKMIEHNLPSIRIQDNISIAKKHLDYETAANVEPDLVPIYADIALISDVPTRSMLGRAVDKVKALLKKGNKEGAKDQLKQLEQIFVYSEVSLPVNETEKMVSAAQDKLAKKDYKGANEDLARAEGGLRMNVTTLVASHLKPSEENKKAE